MRPNKVETAVQWFHMSCAVLAGFSGHSNLLYMEFNRFEFRAFLYWLLNQD